MQTNAVNAANGNMRFAQIIFFSSDPRKLNHISQKDSMVSRLLHTTAPHGSSKQIWASNIITVRMASAVLCVAFYHIKQTMTFHAVLFAN